MTDDITLARAIAQPPQKALTELTKDDIQWRRPISQSASQSCTCKCFEHKQLAAQVTTVNLDGLGDVARCTYRGCDCVEYRPVLPKGVRAHNWIVERERLPFDDAINGWRGEE